MPHGGSARIRWGWGSGSHGCARGDSAGEGGGGVAPVLQRGGEGRARRRQTRSASADLGRAGWGHRGGGDCEKEAAGWEVRARALSGAGEGGPGRTAVRRRGGAATLRAEEGARLGELRRWMGKRGGAGGCWVEGPPREGWMSLPGRRRGSRWLWGWAGRRWLWGWEEKP
jgi:hypothetical protein